MQKEGDAMKYITTLAVLILAISQHSYAGPFNLDQLIDQNVKASVKSYDKTLKGAVQTDETPRLWVHVRSKEQEILVREAGAWMKNIKVDGKAVNLEPVRIVTDGPAGSELRYFKKHDSVQAQKLLQELKKAIPPLNLKDLSPEFEGIPWIKPSHYELWLSPKVSNLRVPQ